MAVGYWAYVPPSKGQLGIWAGEQVSKTGNTHYTLTINHGGCGGTLQETGSSGEHRCPSCRHMFHCKYSSTLVLKKTIVDGRLIARWTSEWLALPDKHVEAYITWT